MVRVAVILRMSVAVLAACSHGSRPAPKVAEPAPEAPSPCTTAVATEDYMSGGFSWWEQPGIAPRRIAGVVTHQGKPVAGARVTLSETEPDERTTDEDGRFDFGERRAAVYTVAAELDGTAGAMVFLDLRNPTPLATPGALELELQACPALISGLVTDDRGNPIGGARVSHSRRGPKAVTDASGRYRLCELAERRRLVVAAKGHPSIQAMAPEVGAGEAEQHFVLPAAGTVSGRTLASDGTPVADVTVVFEPIPRERLSRATDSGADGRFTQPELADGAYLVTARGADVVLPAPRWIVVSGGRADELTLTVEPAATVRGRVLDAGKPVAGAVVKLVSKRGVVAHAISQLDGSFVATGVPRETIEVEVKPFALSAPMELEIATAEPAPLELSIKPSARICGTVVRGGEPVAGQQVMASGNGYAGSVTDADGRFTLVGLAGGTYEVNVGYRKETKRRVHVPEGELYAGVVVELPPLRGAHAVSGIVVDAQMAPVAGVTVGAWSNQGWGRAATGGDGTFVIDGLLAGSYGFTVTTGGVHGLHLRAQGRFPTVSLPTAAPVALQVHDDRLKIYGQVVDASGAPRGGALVVAARQFGTKGAYFGTSFAGRPMAVTDASGRFELTRLPAGDYGLRAMTTSGEEAIVTGVPAGGSAVAVRLQAPGRIDARVVGFSEPVEIDVWRERPEAAVYAGVGGVTSAFTFERLPPGHYLVKARTRAEMAFAHVDVVAGQATKVEMVSSGVGSVDARVVDFATGNGVAGVRCSVGLVAPTASGSIGRWELSATSGADGRLTIDAVPAGELLLDCHALLDDTWAWATAVVTVKRGEKASVEVKTVKHVDINHGGSAGISFEYGGPPVARVARVRHGGPAAEAGILEGDEIAQVDGKNVEGLSGAAVDMLIRSYKPGIVLVLGIVRGQTGFKVKVKLGADDRRKR